MKTPHQVAEEIKQAASESGVRVSVSQGEDGYDRKVSGDASADNYEDALSEVVSLLSEWGYEHTIKGRKYKRVLFTPEVARRDGFKTWYK
jgi:hypothetical protein